METTEGAIGRGGELSDGSHRWGSQWERSGTARQRRPARACDLTPALLGVAFGPRPRSPESGQELWALGYSPVRALLASSLRLSQTSGEGH